MKLSDIPNLEGLIVGRHRELRRFKEILSAKTSQLVIVYGRRRIGKTFLINQFFAGRFDFKLTGRYEQPIELQLLKFTEELNRQSGKEHEIPKDWDKAFFLLREHLSSLPKDEKHVVFFDEMPWLDTQKSGFLPAFEWFWNDWGSAQNNLICIVCGSATAWMIDNIAENKGGLFNRQTCRMYLEPFTLAETEEYLRTQGFTWSRYHIAECYMILGGIPYYLSLLQKRLSFNANIDNLFFRKRAELWDEFDHLYKTLFSQSGHYIKVVETLNTKRMGMTRSEIAASTKLPDTNQLTKILRNLTDSGFVRAYQFFGKKKHGLFYQLADFYTLFYLRFVKENYGKDEHFWSNMIENPSRRAWAGLTFEQLCKDHSKQIKRALGISGVLSEESAWFTQANEEHSGAQIDMIIDRRDQVITICEMKFSLNEYAIDKDYDHELRNKIDTFQRVTKTKKSLQLAFVTTFGLQQNMYSGLVQSQVTMDDLFVWVE